MEDYLTYSEVRAAFKKWHEVHQGDPTVFAPVDADVDQYAAGATEALFGYARLDEED